MLEVLIVVILVSLRMDKRFYLEGKAERERMEQGSEAASPIEPKQQS